MSTARRGAAAVGATLAGVVIVLLFVTLAARAGPSGIVHGTGHDNVFHAPTTSATGSTPPTGPALGKHQPIVPTPVWVKILLLLLAAVACGLVLAAAFSAFGLLRGLSLPGLRRRTPLAEPVEFDWLEDPVAAAEQIRRGADLREQLLRTGTPRNAIVECWSRFEEQASEVGLAPRVWETPSEFTVRVLSALARDRAAIDALERLYVEARFSAHEISEEHRERAIDALRRVHGSLLTAIASDA